MEPIRVLHVLGKLNRGGAETLVMNWYRYMDRSKIQFDFIIHTTEKCSYSDEILSLGGKIYSVPAYCGKNHFQYCKAWKDFFEQHTEHRIIHGHVRSTAAIYLNIAKKYGKITISHSHSTNSGFGIRGLVKRFLQYPIRYIADYKWACSEAAGRYLFGRRQVKSANFKVVNNAIPLNMFSYDVATRQQVRKKMNIQDRFVIGHVGRFIVEKNHEFILELFEKYFQENPKAILLLVGIGPRLEDIRTKVERKGLTHAVFFLGERSDVADIMQALDVFVFPSLYEGLPVTVVEAQATGLPCLISDTVTTEVKVLESTNFLPINQGSEIWVRRIEEIAKQEFERERGAEAVKAAHYDIEDTAKWLAQFYLNISRSTKKFMKNK